MKGHSYGEWAPSRRRIIIIFRLRRVKHSVHNPRILSLSPLSTCTTVNEAGNREIGCGEEEKRGRRRCVRFTHPLISDIVACAKDVS